MGQHYSQLSMRERVTVEVLHREGLSVRSIAARLDRSASTISRELRRNAKTTKHWSGPYDGERAHGLAARRRRWDARYKLARQPDLAADVRERLAMGLSPEQIAGRRPLERGALCRQPFALFPMCYGGEFARHHRLGEELAIPTYFCDPHKPWQKGGVENAIGRMRRYLPPSTTDLEALPTDGIEIVMRQYNDCPRKILGYRTPAEVFKDFITVALQT